MKRSGVIKTMKPYGLKISIFCILIFISHYFPVAGNELKNIDNKVGWIHGNCFAVKNPNISKGSNVIVLIPGNHAEIIHTMILRKTRSAKECSALSEDRRSVNLQKNANSFYLLSNLQPNIIGIGFIKIDSQGQNSNEKLLDLNGDGQKEIFEICTSTEGIHFKIKSIVKNNEIIIWSGYYYLGYDVEPTCP